MCGRFAFYSPREAVARLFAVPDAPAIEPRYNIAPTQFVATVREAGGLRSVAMLYWGLVPFWAKERAIGARLINARAETLAEKPSFRHAFQRRRCLVLADGYYEWQRSGALKQPYFISFDDGQPFGMAGPLGALARSGERRDARVLLHRDHGASEGHRPRARSHARDRSARTPRGVAGLGHDRRPTGSPPCWCPANCRGCGARPVSRRVNDARNQGAGLVEPVGTSDDAA